MCSESTIFLLKQYFFEEGKTIEEAAGLAKVSRQTASRILKSDERYEQEKIRRKKENKIKHNKQIAECVKKQRQIKKSQKETERQEDEAIMWALQELQKQNAVAMSKRRKLQGNNLWEAYASAYRYDPEYVNRAGRLDPSYIWKEDVPFFDEGDENAKKYKRIPVHTSSAAAIIYDERNRVENEKWNSVTEQEALK